MATNTSNYDDYYKRSSTRMLSQESMEKIEKYLDDDFWFHSIKKDFQSFRLNRKSNFDPALNGYSYVFFTAPDLAISKNHPIVKANSSGLVPVILNTNSSVLKLGLDKGEASIYSKEIIETLAGNVSNLMFIFSNRCRSAPMENLELATKEYGETYSGHKIAIGTTTKDTQIDGQVSIKFAEDSDLVITKMAKLWVSYIEGVYKGDVISLQAANMGWDESQNTAIDYMISIFVFNTKPDGTTLTSWSKYTGCFPTNVPLSDLQSEDGEISLVGEVELNFKFSFKEDLDVQILRDFNLLAATNAGSDALFKPAGNNFDEAVVSMHHFHHPNTDKQAPQSPIVRYAGTDKYSGMPIYRLVFGDMKSPEREILGLGGTPTNEFPLSINDKLLDG